MPSTPVHFDLRSSRLRSSESLLEAARTWQQSRQSRPIWSQVKTARSLYGEVRGPVAAQSRLLWQKQCRSQGLATHHGWKCWNGLPAQLGQASLCRVRLLLVEPAPACTSRRIEDQRPGLGMSLRQHSSESLARRQHRRNTEKSYSMLCSLPATSALALPWAALAGREVIESNPASLQAHLGWELASKLRIQKSESWLLQRPPEGPAKREGLVR